MSKGDKGFSLTKTFKPTDELRYKFISDGNWTTDLKAPSFVDDGFGGKNSHVVIADMLGGDDNGAAKAKINFVSWSMIGLQGQYKTAAATDPSKKGLDLNNATIGFKSYDKFTGNFLPNCPFFIELAVAEKELDPLQNGGDNYLYQKDDYGNEVISWGDGLKGLVNGLFSNPVAYLAKTTDNAGGSAGPGTNPFLGHLKFGFNTPYVNFLTGFNYAKPEAAKNILWTTVDGSNWDAGYQHNGGFTAFSLGEKLTKIGDATVNFTFAPNKSADRKGEKYGLWTFANVDVAGVMAEVQYNAFYLGDTLFDKPFEHDVIFGAKGNIGPVAIAGQALLNFYQNLDEVPTGFWDVMGLAGYSRSAVKLSEDFDFTKHVAAEINAKYKSEKFELVADYRFRGWESNMLYVHDHHNDYGKDTQTAQLGVLNSQRISLNATFKPTEALSIQFNPYFEMPFSTKDWDSYYAVYSANRTPNKRIDFESSDSKRFVGFAKVDYDLNEELYINGAVSAYGEVRFVTEDADKYAGYDSKVLFAKAGIKYSMNEVSDVLKGFDIYYGLNNTSNTQVFNTLIARMYFPQEITADVALGLRTATAEYKGDVNNPFGFAVGVSKKLKSFKKPTVYAQFVYDMDPYKNFGDGQDALNLDGYGLGDKVKNSGPDTPAQDAVNVYEGTAAVRVGIRWDI